MLIIERQDRVLELVRQQKVAQLEDLARQLNVSASTIRRDLDALAKRGLVERTHGGAVCREDEVDHATVPVALNRRMDLHRDRKLAIGAEAAKLVRPQMTLLLDGGSTVIYAAQQVEARPIQIVTNSLALGNLMVDDDDVELVLVGGQLYPRTAVCIGPIATGSLADLHADLCLFSLDGIYGDEAFNINLTMAEVEQMMIRQAAQSVLLMDSSKFDRKSLVRVCGLDEVDLVITDSEIDDSWRDRLGDRLLVAEYRSSGK